MSKNSIDDAQRRHLAEEVRRARQTRGITQQELARIAGISQSLVSLVETGSRELPVSALERIVRELDIDADSLLGTSRPAEVLEMVTAAWDAYEKAQQAAETFYHKANSRAVFLGRMVPRFRPVLSGRDLEQFEELKQIDKSDELVLSGLPSKEEHPKFRELAGASLPSLSEFKRAKRLVEAAKGLHSEDIDLLVRIAERLRQSRVSFSGTSGGQSTNSSAE
jgi:transcriptional regulator with XRE-family HTH domain